MLIPRFKGSKREAWEKEISINLTEFFFFFFTAVSAVCIAEMVGDVTNFDLPAGQGSVCHLLQVQACRCLVAVLQGELALQRRYIQKDGQDKLGLVQNPLPIVKLDERHRGREGGSHEWQEVQKREGH